MNESSSEQQFYKLDAIPLLWEKSGAILLVLVGLTAGSPAVRRILVDFKIPTDRIIRIFMVFNKGTVLL